MSDRCRVVLIVAMMSCHIAQSARAEEPTTQPAEPLSLESTHSPGKAPRKPYPDPIGIGAKRVRDVPAYAHPFRPHGDEGESLDWFEFGIQNRTRFEIRDDYYRQNFRTDDYFLMQTRGYLGITKVLDPLRLGFEFLDARRFGDDFPRNNREIDQADILQAFVELYFDDALGPGEPLSFYFGRMSFDTGDRRLFARNRWPYAPNAFDGFRLRLGDQASVWEADMFAFQPVQRRLYRLDRSDDDQMFYGVVGYWRGWSPYLTLEPYWFYLDEYRGVGGNQDREMHTVGLRGYGLIGDTGFDYDFNVAYQFGNYHNGDIRAFATHAEVGYTFDHAWKPRLATMFDYATGDPDPNDRLSERFDPLYGAPHPFYGFSDNFTWQNLINPALCFSMKPTDRLSMNALYRVYWLASDKDAFVRANIIDPTGTSGHFIGQEFDVSANYKIDKHASLEVGYAGFLPGSFVESASPTSPDSDFFYVQMTLNF